MDVIWNKIDETNAVLKNQDKAIENIICRCQNMEMKVNNLDHATYQLDMEKNLDTRITAFITVITADMEEKLAKITKFMETKFQDVHNKINKLHQASIQEQKERKNENEFKGIATELNNISKDPPVISNDIKKSIQDLKNNMKTFNEKISTHTDNLKSLETRIASLSSIKNNLTQTPAVPSKSSQHFNTQANKTELLLCFDSNRRYLDMKKLWKVKNSQMKACSTIYDVSQIFESNQFESTLKYVLLNVGMNDLDTKDHTQVFGEAELLFDQIRSKLPGIKLIISEITPRADQKDPEVKAYNHLLNNYATGCSDITVATHSNLRDPTWSMFKANDVKHIRKDGMGKFASNLIRALKTAYGITSKSELFKDPTFYRTNTWHPKRLMDIPCAPPRNIGTRLRRIAEYQPYQENETFDHQPVNNENIIRPRNMHSYFGQNDNWFR